MKKSEHLRSERRRERRMIVALAAFLATGMALTCAASPADGLAVRVEADATREDASGADDLGTLEDYLRRAALNNPGLEAAFLRWRAALETVSQKRALPDPRLTYRHYFEEVETRVGPQRRSVGIAQTFPWPGTLGLRGAVATNAAEAERLRYEAEKLKVFHEVKAAYAEYYYLGQAIRIVEENRRLTEEIENLSRVRYEVGEASHPSLIRAQVELGRLDDRLRSLKDRRGPVLARLNAAMARPPEAPLPWPTDVGVMPLAVTDAEVFTLLGESSPELQALASEAAAAERRIGLARKGYYPDITLGMDYIDTRHARTPGVKDSGKDPVVGAISINLPIWFSKYRAAEREAKARYRSALKARAQAGNALSARVAQALYEVRDAGRKHDLYGNTLLPKARESLDAQLSGFRAGTVGFTDMLDAQRILLEFSLMNERALSDLAAWTAELEMLVGRELTSLTAPDEAQDRKGEQP